MNATIRNDRHSIKHELSRAALDWKRPLPAPKTTPKAAITAAALLLVAMFANSASAVLNEFSQADGYMNPFSTPVWTYNPLWTFDGGAINSNYVAQHGYNAGFALGEPFALVVRNDNAAGNYRFHYDFVSADLAGLNPASLNNQVLQLNFDVCSTVAQNSGTINNVPMMTMKFGGTATNPGLTFGFSDSNKLMWSNAGGVLNEFNGYTLNGGGWDRVTLNLDFASDTYDLSISPMTGDGINASNTYTPTTTFNVVSGMAFTNPLSSMQQLYFETFTDPEDGGGWHKMFLDNFDSSRGVPEPTSFAIGSLGFLTFSGFRARRRRSAQRLDNRAVTTSEAGRRRDHTVVSRFHVTQRQGGRTIFSFVRTAAAIFVLSIGLAVAGNANADNWTMSITVDNAYNVYFGDQFLTTPTFVGGDPNWPTTETWNIAGVNPTDFLYVATASDHSVAQGFLGSFTNTTTANTFVTSDAPTPWEVFPAGAYLPQLNAIDPSIPAGVWPAGVQPTTSQVQTAVTYATQNNLWVPPTSAPGYNNAPTTAPWGLRPSIPSNAEWIWYDNGQSPGGSYPSPFDGFNHDEFLVFRVPGVPIPEPASAVLLVASLVGLARVRPCRKRSRLPTAIAVVMAAASFAVNCECGALASQAEYVQTPR